MTTLVKDKDSVNERPVKGVSYNNLIDMSDCDLIDTIQKIDAKLQKGVRIPGREAFVRNHAQTIILDRYTPYVENRIKDWEPFTDNYHVDDEDVAQAVREGLLKAIDKFDVSSNNSLMAFAKMFVLNSLVAMQKSAGFSLSKFRTSETNCQAIKKARELQRSGQDMNTTISQLMEEFGLRMHLAHTMCSEVYYDRKGILEYVEDHEDSCHVSDLSQKYSEFSSFYLTPEERLGDEEVSSVLGKATDRALSNVKPIVRTEFLKRFQSTSRERTRYKSLPQIFAEHGITGRTGEPLSSERIRQTFKEIEASILKELKQSFDIHELSDLL